MVGCKLTLVAAGAPRLGMVDAAHIARHPAKFKPLRCCRVGAEGEPFAASRRQLLQALGLGFSLPQLSGSPSASASAVDAPAATVQPQLAPNQSLYDAADPQLREAAQVLQRALGADSVQVRPGECLLPSMPAWMG